MHTIWHLLNCTTSNDTGLQGSCMTVTFLNHLLLTQFGTNKASCCELLMIWNQRKPYCGIPTFFNTIETGCYFLHFDVPDLHTQNYLIISCHISQSPAMASTLQMCFVQCKQPHTFTNNSKNKSGWRSLQ